MRTFRGLTICRGERGLEFAQCGHWSLFREALQRSAEPSAMIKANRIRRLFKDNRERGASPRRAQRRERGPQRELAPAKPTGLSAGKGSRRVDP